MSDRSEFVTVETQPKKLSDYEQERARNIERNNSRLRSLGLISALEERESNDLAWGITPDVHTAASRGTDEGKGVNEVGKDDDGNCHGRNHKKRSSHCVGKGIKRKSTMPREGSRKSQRLQGISVKGDDGHSSPLGTSSRDEEMEKIHMEREERVKECREARQRAAKAVADAGAEAAGKENPTATYDHCLMRVRTMTEKGLTNRVRAIERAAGRHCVVKMAIFKSCLQDEGMWELAQLASDALERLKALQPPPE